jgi:hypothetical protein
MMIDDAARAVDEQHPQVPVACFADAEQLRLTAGRMLARHQPEVSGELPPVFEAPRLADRGDDGGGDKRTDTGDGNEPLADWVGIEDGFDPFIEQGEPVVERAELVAQRMESLLRHGREADEASRELFAQPDEEARDAFGADDAIFQEQATDLVDERGAMMDETFPDAMQRLEVLLIGSLDGHCPHVGTRRGFGDGGGIVAVVLGSLAEGDDILGGDELDLVSECGELARPVLRAGAGLHRDATRRKVGEEE